MAKLGRGDKDGSEWRLELEGGVEVPEIIIVSDAVEGIFAELDGESRHEHVEAQLSRRGREVFNEGEEIRSPKRKVIRVGNTGLCERRKEYGS